jgi:hypothetical protein
MKQLMTWTFALVLALSASAVLADEDLVDNVADNAAEVAGNIDSAAASFEADHRDSMDNAEENLTEAGDNLSSAAHDLIGDPHEEDHTAVNASIEETAENIEEATAPIAERINTSAASFEEEHREGLDNLENRLRGFGDRLGRFGRRNNDE